VTHPSKAKGNVFERELVQLFEHAGVVAERAYGSNGKALGEAEGVDVSAGGCRVQAKRRKQLPAWLRMPDGCDCVIFREDRGTAYVMIEAVELAQLIRRAGGF
jgi:Holliday junction resolvase